MVHGLGWRWSRLCRLDHIAHADRQTTECFGLAILFFAIPLFALTLLAGRHALAIFKPVRLRDSLWIVGVALLNIVVSFGVALVVRQVFDMNANPVGAMLSGYSSAELSLFYLRTISQLFGEEVVSVLPFLAILWFCSARLKMGRKAAVIVAWIGAALVFGALHLPTYGWNYVQCFLVIGSAHVVLLLAYVATKNIWVSTGAHILNDWVMFTTIVVLLGSQAT